MNRVHTDRYGLIVSIRRDSVMLESKGNEHRLPRIEIPQLTRPAKKLPSLFYMHGVSAVFFVFWIA